MEKTTSLIEIAEVMLGPKLGETDFLESDNMKEVNVLDIDNIMESKTYMTLDNTIKLNSANNEGKKQRVKFSRKIKNGLIRKEDLIVPLKKSDHKCRFVHWLSDEPMNYIYNTETITIRVDKEVVLPKFMYYLLVNEDVLKYINENAKTKPNRISCELINNLKFEIPPISEQKIILQELDRINIERVRIEEQISKYTINYKK